MSNKLSKFSFGNFRPVYRSRKLSLATRIEILRKRHLIKKAKLLLKKGLEDTIITPVPASYQDSFEKTINVEVLAELLERTKEMKRTQLIEYQSFEKKLDKGIFTDSDSDNNSDETDNNEENTYDSDKFEDESESLSDSDIEKGEKEPLVSELPEIVNV